MADRTLRVIFAGDASRAIAASRGLQSNLKRVGSSLTSAGRTLTRTVTLPLVAAGAASLKLAVDFEQAFTKIDAVSNASQEQIQAWRKDVLKLSGQTARAPEELADALYFLASAGLKANQVIPVLEMSAKAAAVGLGTTADIARLTANVLNAYAKEGITAAEATDTLFAAVKEGTAEPEEFANALGRILPIAAKAKIGFDQVTAGLANLSNIGLDVNEGVTAMRGVFLALYAPTQQTEDALKDLGITTTELRDRIEKRGILDTLRYLEKQTGGNIDKMRDLVPNVRALTAVFGLTEQEANKVSGSFDRIADSTGELEKAFLKTKKGSAYKFFLLMALMKRLAIQLGEILLPFARKAAKELGKLVKKFEELSPATQKTIIKFAALAVVLGPVLRITGSLVNIFGGLVAIFGGAVVAAAAVNVALAALYVKFEKVRTVVNFVLKQIVLSFAPFLAVIHNSIQAVEALINAIQKIPSLGGSVVKDLAPGIQGAITMGGGGGNSSTIPGGKGGPLGASPRRSVVINVNGGNTEEVRRVIRQELEADSRRSTRIARPRTPALT